MVARARGGKSACFSVATAGRVTVSRLPLSVPNTQFAVIELQSTIHKFGYLQTFWSQKTEITIR